MGGNGAVSVLGLTGPETVPSSYPDDLKQGFYSQMGFLWDTLSDDYRERGRYLEPSDASSFTMLPYESETLDYRGSILKKKLITSIIKDQKTDLVRTLSGSLRMKGELEALGTEGELRDEENLAPMEDVPEGVIGDESTDDPTEETFYPGRESEYDGAELEAPDYEQGAEYYEPDELLETDLLPENEFAPEPAADY